MKYEKPTDLLDELDSHGIYSATMLDECEFDTSSVPVQPHTMVAAAIKGRGLGGELGPDTGEGLITGYLVATALARQFVGEAPGLRFQGRGSSFRADVAALKEAGY